MRRTYKVLMLIGLVSILILSFQNCGKSPSNTSAPKDIFIHFNDLQNTDFEIVSSNCSQGSECLFTLHTLERDNEVIGNKMTASEPPPQDPATEPIEVELSNLSGMYCDVLQQSGFGDVYVSCPQEVQNDVGFYIRL